MSLFGILILFVAALLGGIIYLRWIRKRGATETGETAGPPAEKRSIKSNVLIISLNSVLLAVFIFSAWGFKDVSEYAAQGGDPLGLLFLPIVSVPSLLVLGITLLGLKNRLRIPLFNGLIPFIGILGFYLALVVNGATPTGQGSIVHDYWTRVGLIGAGMGGILGMLTVATTVKTLIPKRKVIKTAR